MNGNRKYSGSGSLRDEVNHAGCFWTQAVAALFCRIFLDSPQKMPVQ